MSPSASWTASPLTVMPPSISPTVGTISSRHRDPSAASGYGLRPDEDVQRFGRGVPAVGSGMGSDGAYFVRRGAGSVVEIASRVRLLPAFQSARTTPLVMVAGPRLPAAPMTTTARSQGR